MQTFALEHGSMYISLTTILQRRTLCPQKNKYLGFIIKSFKDGILNYSI